MQRPHWEGILHLRADTPLKLQKIETHFEFVPLPSGAQFV
jgi:hypothetical protein